MLTIDMDGEKVATGTARDGPDGATLWLVFAWLRRLVAPGPQASDEAAEARAGAIAATRQAAIVDELDDRSKRVLGEMAATQKLLTELRGEMDAPH